MQVGEDDVAVEHLRQALGAFVGEDALFVVQIAVETGDVLFENLLGAFVEFGTLTREDFAIDDDAFDAGRAVEGSVFDVAGFLAEDGPEELLFRSQLRFALRGDLAD